MTLAGCVNQKLYNKGYALTVQAPRLAAGDPVQGAAWEIPFTVQPAFDLRISNGDNLEPQDMLVIFKDGSRFMQRNTPVALAVSTAASGSSYFPARTISQGTLTFKRDENEAESNPTVKLTLPLTRLQYNAQTYPGVSIDLTCTK